MEYYQLETILFKKKDTTKLKVQVVIGAPARVNFVISFDESGPLLTKIGYHAKRDDKPTEDRDLKITKEFDWDGTGRSVTTEVYDLEPKLQSSNTIHTDNAIQY
jgi:hypothetical protein